MIRKDLFAVKVFSDVGYRQGAWVTELVTGDRRVAFRYRQDTIENHHRDFPLVEPRVVHPSQELVGAFLAVGNSIR